MSARNLSTFVSNHFGPQLCSIKYLFNLNPCVRIALWAEEYHCCPSLTGSQRTRVKWAALLQDFPHSVGHSFTDMVAEVR